MKNMFDDIEIPTSSRMDKNDEVIVNKDNNIIEDWFADDMKLIKEFYEDYRLKEEYKKGFTICIKKLITINLKKN